MAKQLLFDEEARHSLKRGIDALADAASAAEIELDTIEAIPIEEHGKPSGLIWYTVVEACWLVS